MSRHRGSRKPGFPKNCCAHAPDSVDPRHDSISAIRRGRCTNAYEKAGAKFLYAPARMRYPLSTKFAGQQSISRGGVGATAQNAHHMHGEAGVQWAQPSFISPEIPPVDT